MNIDKKDWLYDEFEHCGVDYADSAVAGKYDERHENFRNFPEEAQQIVELLNLKNTDTIIDLGTGTGGIAVHLAKRVRKVHAIDVSDSMLDICREKCQQMEIENVDFHRAGFLNYEHKGEEADAVISQIAMHHLPDMFKQIALFRCNKMLKPGGTLFLVDVVFDFDADSYANTLQEWIDEHVREVGPEAITHIKEEFSTMGWIMWGMIERAGFKIEQIINPHSSIKKYLCRKVS